MYSFPSLEPVHCFLLGSNCCFLTCIQISQEEGKVVWYSHHFKNFPQFVVIHAVKGFSIVSEAEIDVFLEFLPFLWSSGCWQFDPCPLPFLYPACTSGSFWFMNNRSLAWRILSISLLSHHNECNCAVVWAFSVIVFLCDWNENWHFPVISITWGNSKIIFMTSIF